MATNQIALNVYEIDGQPVVPSAATDFSATGIQVLPYLAGRDSRLYSIVIPVATQRAYGVIETPAVIKTLCNS